MNWTYREAIDPEHTLSLTLKEVDGVMCIDGYVAESDPFRITLTPTNKEYRSQTEVIEQAMSAMRLHGYTVHSVYPLQGGLRVKTDQR